MSVLFAGLAACSGPRHASPDSFACAGRGGVSTNVAGRAAMGVGTDGPISDIDVAIGAHMRPGRGLCPDAPPESQF